MIIYLNSTLFDKLQDMRMKRTCKLKPNFKKCQKLNVLLQNIKIDDDSQFNNFSALVYQNNKKLVEFS